MTTLIGVDHVLSGDNNTVQRVVQTREIIMLCLINLRTNVSFVMNNSVDSCFLLYKILATTLNRERTLLKHKTTLEKGVVRATYLPLSHGNKP